MASSVGGLETAGARRREQRNAKYPVQHSSTCIFAANPRRLSQSGKIDVEVRAYASLMTLH